MEWHKLNKKSLKQLKQIENRILVVSNNNEFPYDIIFFLDLNDLGLSKEEMKQHWSGLISENYEYDDETLLDLFTHYHVLIKPK